MLSLLVAAAVSQLLFLYNEHDDVYISGPRVVDVCVCNDALQSGRGFPFLGPAHCPFPPHSTVAFCGGAAVPY